MPFNTAIIPQQLKRQRYRKYHTALSESKPKTWQYFGDFISHYEVGEIKVSFTSFCTWLFYANVQANFQICVMLANGKIAGFFTLFFNITQFKARAIANTGHRPLSVCRYVTANPFFLSLKRKQFWYVFMCYFFKQIKMIVLVSHVKTMPRAQITWTVTAVCVLPDLLERLVKQVWQLWVPYHIIYISVLKWDFRLCCKVALICTLLYKEKLSKWIVHLW